MEQVTAKPFEDQVVYLGIDQHAKSLVVQPALAKTMTKRFTISPVCEKALINKLNKEFPGASFKAVHEAGFSGFWLQRVLQDNGIECVIVNPADLATTHKDRKRKTDQRDASALARALRNDDIEGVYVPDKAAERRRYFIRHREQLVKERRRCQQQLKAHLKLDNDTPEGLPTGWQYSKKNLRILSAFAARRFEGRPDYVLGSLIERFVEVDLRLNKHNRELDLLLKELDGELYECLLSIPGIGSIISAYLMLEIIDMERFANNDKLCAYVGLVPDVYASGDRENSRGITSRAHRPLRRMLIESSWTAMRHDRTLMAAYGRYSRRMAPNKAIIKIARKLLCRVRAVWLARCKYDESLSK